jgi:hypothetical protein
MNQNIKKSHNVDYVKHIKQLGIISSHYAGHFVIHGWNGGCRTVLITNQMIATPADDTPGW